MKLCMSVKIGFEIITKRPVHWILAHVSVCIPGLKCPYYEWDLKSHLFVYTQHADQELLNVKLPDLYNLSPKPLETSPNNISDLTTKNIWNAPPWNIDTVKLLCIKQKHMYTTEVATEDPCLLFHSIWIWCGIF